MALDSIMELNRHISLPKGWGISWFHNLSYDEFTAHAFQSTHHPLFVSKHHMKLGVHAIMQLHVLKSFSDLEDL